ncbi:phage tail tape measure protein [Paracoccus liaowanqingii]|uniref:Phage tail tape measure protein n=1 Tax=Paracoccus liaowanqingii TaxID=2560053 RepID=A0A4P7HIC4_9RHOB|nr:phage tail tape measure protein [Paracoccus liaowanqingii]QBX33403.1 phage tail tape measure protein [Paracoccus liaowanqingii]
MADVDIVVESGDLKAAIALLNEYGVSFTQMVNKVQTEGNRLNRASKATTDQLTRAWQNAEKAIDNRRLEQVASQEADILKRREQNWRQFFQSYGKSTSAGQLGAPTSAAGSALLQNEKALSDAMLETAKAAKEKAKEAEYLTRTLNPLLAAEQTYLRMQSEISRATDLGILDIQQQAVALDQLQKEYDALGNGVYMTGSRFNRFGEMAVQNGKGIQKFGMYAQQAGYQIGDFAVQLQAGQNAGVAFSQQAAQLAGLIPGLAGAMTTFAAIGVGLLIQNMTKGEKAAEDTYLQLSKFQDLEQVFSSVGSSFETSMVQSISRVRQKYGDFIADFAKFSLNAEKEKLQANLSTVMDKASSVDPTASEGFWGRFKNTRTLMNPGATSFIADAQAEADAYNEMLAQVQAAQERLFNDSINSKSELVTAFQAVYEEMREIPGVTQEILDRFQQVGEQSGIAAEATKTVSEAFTAANNAASQGFELYKQMNEELRLSNELASVRNRYGEDSVQYLDAQKKQTLEITRTELERAGTTDTLIEKIMAQVEQQIEFEQAALRSELVVDQLLIDLSAMSGIDISGVFTKAQGAANSLLGTVQSIYANMAAVAAETKIRERAAVAKGNPLDPLGAFSGGQSASGAVQIAAGGVIRSPVMPDWEEPKSGGGGGKGGGRSKLSDAEKHAQKAQDQLKEFFEQYNLNIKQQERLAGIHGEQREELEKVIEIEKRLGESRTLVSQTQIEAMAREELALERKLDRQEEIYNLGNQAVEDLLMSIVAGTGDIEDAFKGMLSSIVAEVYQNYVAKGAADMAGNALVSLFSANGNAFGAGGVKMFMDGGVVGSPTLFGYGSGKTGMMGEAGPEAIMPLKRNSQGQLGVAVSGGGSGAVNVYHNINISANGDESVNKIITAQIPRITEASKRAVMDAKRRGQKGF